MGGAIRGVFALGILFAILMLISAGAGTYVSHQRLQRLSDSAALAGAGAIDLDAYLAQGADNPSPINEPAAQKRIKEVLRRAPDSHGVALEGFSVSGADVHVSLSVPLNLELVGTTFDLELRADSYARLVYTPGGP